MYIFLVLPSIEGATVCVLPQAVGMLDGFE
jgi:hypothetical protein